MDKCFTVVNTLLAWRDCTKTVHVNSGISIFSPILNNPDLSKYLLSIDINKWTKSGIKQLKHLFHKDITMKSVNDLRAEYDISNKDFFRYLQIRNVIQSIIKSNKLRPGLLEEEEILMSKVKLVNLMQFFLKELSHHF